MISVWGWCGGRGRVTTGVGDEESRVELLVMQHSTQQRNWLSCAYWMRKALHAMLAAACRLAGLAPGSRPWSPY